MGSNKTKLLNSCGLIIAILCLLQLNMSRAQKVTAMYVFGDSLVDVGNNNYLDTVFRANFLFNGIDFPGGKPTGRFSNGKNAADFIAENVGLSTPPPYLSNKNDLFLKGVSFASGGAGILNSTNDHPYNGTIYLSKQVGYFSEVQQRLIKNIGESATKKHLSNSLFTFVIGSNDLFNYFTSKSRFPTIKSPQEYIDLMLSTFSNHLMQIHGLGGRKYVIVGIGPIGCTPAQRLLNSSYNCNDEANHWAIIYNKSLQSMLLKLKSKLKQDFSYSYFNIYDFLVDLIQNPTKYGFLEVKSACCGIGKLYAEGPCIPLSKYCPNRSDHIFWDEVHPTEATAKILVNTLFNNTKKYVTSMNLTIM
ncbi:GDSL esterase/lipase At5g55050-like [Solanum dulcamara]|uniref:GDSL esterase/lipase At5g55050-like n=1 Tax=Solanum dulcamara TaxID=45834 RepID=UPI0024850F96|nr:GDSL esterase/lipase At5g55050-like [Solanum dulcamara]